MLKLIIAEDEKIMREGLSNTIPWSDWGIEVVGKAANGSEALGLIKDILPDIVLTDIRMPVMDGLELLRKVKGSFPEISVILLSGHEEFEYAKAGIDYGADAYVLKLNVRKELETAISKVREQIARRKQQQELQSQGKIQLFKDFIRDVLYVDANITDDFDLNSRDKESVDFKALREIEKNILFALEMNSIKKVLELLDDWFEKWEDPKNSGSDLFCNHCINLLSILRWRHKESKSDIDSENVFDMRQIQEINSIDVLKKSVIHFVMTMMKSREKIEEKQDILQINSIVEYLQQHYMEKITLKDIAEYVYVNPSYLSAVFKEKTGKSFTDYQVEIKMKMVCRFIENGMKVHEAAEKVGYSDLKHFRQTFKKVIGTNPGDYCSSISS